MSFIRSHGEYLCALAEFAEQVFEALGFPVACVCGVKRVQTFQIHALGAIPPAVLTRAYDQIVKAVPSGLCLHLSSRSRPGQISALEVTIRFDAPGEACGTCGTRAVVARRCEFCGARA